jgi:hypothetical protein
MLEPGLVPHRARLECLGPIGDKPVPVGAVDQLLDTVDIWLAGTLQTLFTLIKR